MNRPFRWCLDNYHENCRKQYEDWNHNLVVCSCDCHDRKEQK